MEAFRAHIEKNIKEDPVLYGILLFLMLCLFILVCAILIKTLEQGVRVDDIKPNIVRRASPFDTLTLSGKSIYVWDVNKKQVLYAHDENTPRPLASLTKIMMALTATDLIPQYTVIKIDKNFLKEEGDTGLLADEKWQLKKLLDFSLITSSNDGARAIASVAGAVITGTDVYDIGRAAFIEKMNEKGREIGLSSSTYFLNEDGVDTTSTTSGAYGSARDMARVFEYGLRSHPEIFEATKHGDVEISSLNNISHDAKNTNVDINQIPGIIASKTGYTTLAGGNLVVVFDAGLDRPIIISVLGSTYTGRFEDIAKLVEATRTYINNN